MAEVIMADENELNLHESKTTLEIAFHLCVLKKLLRKRKINCKLVS